MKLHLFAFSALFGLALAMVGMTGAPVPPVPMANVRVPWPLAPVAHGAIPRINPHKETPLALRSLAAEGNAPPSRRFTIPAVPSPKVTRAVGAGIGTVPKRKPKAEP